MSRRPTLVQVLTLVAISGLTGLSANASPLASLDLIVATTGGCCSPSTLPNVYHLDSTGAFLGFSYSPFSATDIAVDKAGSTLFSSANSGTIVATDPNGGLVRLISTPLSGINGLAVESNGNLLAASGSNFYTFDANGGFLGLVFSQEAPFGPFGVTTDNVAVFPDQGFCCQEEFTTLNFFDLETRNLTEVPTSFSSIRALDVSEDGEIIVAGDLRTNGFSSTTGIFRLDMNGVVLGQIAGPQNVTGLAVANLPEPGTAMLIGAGLSLLGARRRRASSVRCGLA